MGKLIKFEFRKIFKSKYLYVLLSISLVLVVVTGAIQKLLPTVLTFVATGFLVEETTMTPYAFAKSSLTISFSLISGILISLNATEDFAHSTIKNIFSKGYSRKSVFISKYLVSLVACFIIAVSNFIFALIIGSMFFDSKEIIEEYAFYIYLGQILAVIAYHSLYFFIAYSLRRIGPSIAICVLISGLAALLFTLIDYLLKSSDQIVSRYWIDNVVVNLTNKNTDDELLVPNLLTLTGYIVTFFLGGFFINSRKEV